MRIYISYLKSVVSNLTSQQSDGSRAARTLLTVTLLEELTKHRLWIYSKRHLLDKHRLEECCNLSLCLLGSLLLLLPSGLLCLLPLLLGCLCLRHLLGNLCYLFLDLGSFFLWGVLENPDVGDSRERGGPYVLETESLERMLVMRMLRVGTGTDLVSDRLLGFWLLLLLSLWRHDGLTIECVDDLVMFFVVGRC